MDDVARREPSHFPEGTLAARTIRSAFRGLWHGVIPAVLALAFVRTLLPNPTELEGGALSRFTFRLAEHPIEVFAAIFVLLAAIVRTVHDWIPGGRYLSSLPLPLVPTVPEEDTADYETAVAVHRSVLRALRRGEVAAPADVALAVGELHDAISSGPVARVRVATAKVRDLGRTVLAARERREGVQVAVAIAGAALAALVLKSSVLSIYRVEGNSMLPTLRPGDHLAVRIIPRRFFPFGVGRSAKWVPKRGDVVLFADAGDVGPAARVKRVIGLPGDRIKMDGLFPIINGWTVPSCNVGPYAYFTAGVRAYGRMRVEFLEDQAYLVLFGNTGPELEGEYTVKPSEVFVIGDDRSDSLDSRSLNSGFGGGIDLGLLQGRADRIVYGLRADGSVDLDHLFRSLDTRFVLEGVSVSVLEERVRGCLAKRPKHPYPPAPTGPISPSAALGPGEMP
ncbi:MAG TPA: signal peptidase I [Polyangiaceae bacterium]|nr:signal peptidase I [Polyangiaceae bacterium]